MNLGLAVSLLLHGTLLAWALISFQQTPAFKPPEIVPVEVALISADDLVRLRQGDRDSKNLETAPSKQPVKEPEKEAPKPRPAAAAPPPPAAEPPPPPPPPPAPTPPAKAEPAPKQPDQIASLIQDQPPPEPAPDALALQQAAAVAEAKRKADEEQQRKAEAEKKRLEEQKKRELAKKRADEKKKRDDDLRKAQEKQKSFSERMNALLNKVPDSAAPKAGSDQPPKANLPKGPAAGAPEGRDTRLTASQQSMMNTLVESTMQPHWRINCGVNGIEEVVVKVEVRYKPDGYLAVEPRVVNTMSSPLFAPAAQLALSAIKLAEPVQWPADLYKGGWDAAIQTFNARRACGL